jgi:cobalt-zinc-cadmium efflux system outer membrane protein
MAANARLRSAGALQSPQLAVATHAGQNAAGLDEDIVLTQTIELGDKVRQRIRSARAERDSSVAAKRQTLADLANSAKSAYFEALRSEADREISAKSLEAAQDFVKVAELQFQAGDIPRSNVLRSQVELSRAETAVAAAESDRASRYAVLRSITGLPEDAAVTLADKLEFITTQYQLPELRTLALKNRADILSAQLTRTAREAALREARSKTQPDLFIEGRHADVTKMNRDNSLRVGFSIPLFDLGHASGDVRAARAALDEQDAILAENIRTARLEVETAFRSLDQARRTVDSFQAGRVEKSRTLLEMAQTGYSRRAISYLELLDAQQTYRTEQAEYTRALAAYNTAKAALEKAVGGTLP